MAIIPDDGMLEELGRFDQNFTPTTGQRAGLDSLADGSYEFDTVDAELVRSPKKGELILRRGLKVLAGPSGLGSVVEYVNFFKSQDNIDFLGGELSSLGFDVEKWTAAAGRPFSKELNNLIVNKKLVGIRFRANKKTNGQYHNIYVVARIDGAKQPTSKATVSQSAPNSGPISNEVPF